MTVKSSYYVIKQLAANKRSEHFVSKRNAFLRKTVARHSACKLNTFHKTALQHLVQLGTKYFFNRMPVKLLRESLRYLHHPACEVQPS